MYIYIQITLHLRIYIHKYLRYIHVHITINLKSCINFWKSTSKYNNHNFYVSCCLDFQSYRKAIKRFALCMAFWDFSLELMTNIFEYYVQKKLAPNLENYILTINYIIYYLGNQSWKIGSKWLKIFWGEGAWGAGLEVEERGLALDLISWLLKGCLQPT